MNLKRMRMAMWVGLGLTLQAQIPSGLDLQALKQMVVNQVSGAPGGSDVTPPTNAVQPATPGMSTADQAQPTDDEKIQRDIDAMKKREKGPLRFSSDLFTYRQKGTFATDGGISEDYVLGTGDQLAVNAFGSATFNFATQVDGRGQVVIPKVGAVKVAGLTLGSARQAVQQAVGRNFSKTNVDLQVLQLREIRVFVAGEVYKPGAYLVPSLSSLVNVLSLAGGPTAMGSFRDIRVMRGGKAVVHFDLYPFRAEGIGNPNVVLQSGDSIFVPLIQNQVTLEGAFERVVGQLPPEPMDDTDESFKEVDPAKDQLAKLMERKRALESQLAPQAPNAQANSKQPLNGTDKSGKPALPASMAALGGMVNPTGPAPLSGMERAALEGQIQDLQDQIDALKSGSMFDHRLKLDPTTGQPFKETDKSTPDWIQRWDDTGVAPTMAFEMKPGETAADALRFAGGFSLQGGGVMTLRRRDLSGVMSGQDVPVDQAAQVALQRGDLLSALPQRDQTGAVVQVMGWVRVPGTYARTANLRVGDFLRRENQLLPDTYHPRGEVVRTLADGTTQYFAFDLDKAMAGDPAHNLLLQDRDKVELYRKEDFRLPETVSVLGPVTRPGVYAFHEGMRASDLIFRAGTPLKSASSLVAELAHSRPGQPSQVVRLDLPRLLSTGSKSPVDLTDETVNPSLQPDDQLSIFEVPDFKVHRTVHISGQVLRPGDYTLDSDHPTLSQLIQRAGGLAPQAMPEASVFLRRIGKDDADLRQASKISGISQTDPTSKGINEILERLNETTRNPLSGLLQPNDILHALTAGSLSRLVVDFKAALKGDAQADVELQDGDQIVIPRLTDAAYVVGEAASPFATYKVHPGMKVAELLKLAGGTTRNADTWNMRLLKADGRIIDSWVSRQAVGPGDTLLVPQRIRRDSNWQEDLQALTPIAVMLSVLKL